MHVMLFVRLRWGLGYIHIDLNLLTSIEFLFDKKLPFVSVSTGVKFFLILFLIHLLGDRMLEHFEFSNQVSLMALNH